jgi:SpoVK/Ycf46/Vps4 family AAA+-type ATPase
MAGKPLAQPELLKRLADETEGWSGADIEVFCNRAALNALAKSVAAAKEGYEPGEVSITSQNLDDALDFVENQRFIHAAPPLPVATGEEYEEEE